MVLTALATLSLVVNGLAVGMAIAMILLVVWQAPRHRENQLLAVYFLAFGWASAMICVARIADVLGRDPSRPIMEAFAGTALAAVTFFTLSAYVSNLWRRAWVRFACGGLFAVCLLVVRPLLVHGDLVIFTGYTPEGTTELHFLPTGWLVYASFVVLFVAGLVLLWRYRGGRAGLLLPGGIVAVVGFLIGFAVPGLRQYSVAVLASVFGAILWTRAILRDRLFDPLQELNDSLQEANAIAVQKNEHLKQEIAAREALIAELDAFAHTVAHDLKNPLAPIIAAAEELQMLSPPRTPAATVMRGPSPAAAADADTAEDIQAELLDMVLRNGRRMARIIDELLLLARVRRGEVELSPLDMPRIVEDALDRLRGMSESTGAVIVKPDIWPRALGHPQWVEEVWTNYLTNAVKYGGRPPHIELGWAQDGEHALRFWVRDDGPGLTDEDQTRLFTPFTRMHQTTASGEGLGLSIVQRIVARLGGKVGVVSRAHGESGSEFWFVLPASPDQVRAASEFVAGRDGQLAAPGDPLGQNVML